MRAFFNWRWASLTVVVAALFPADAAPQLRATMATSEVTVLLEGNSSAPRLLALQSAGSPPRVNRDSDTLIPVVELGGKSLKLSWKLNRNATRLAERSATFVYESDSPKLRLRWRWSARSRFGLVEHGSVSSRSAMFDLELAAL